MTEEITKEEIISRIRNYFGNGGLFNPEMMEHEKVRDLLLDVLVYFDNERKRIDNAKKEEK